MKRLAIFFIFGGLFLTVSIGGLWTQEYNDDPFASMFPKKETPIVVQPLPIKVEPVVTKPVEPPNVVVTGIVWGGNFPQAVINGKVYRVGETIKETEAVVESIEKGEVKIILQGTSFSFRIVGKKMKEIGQNNILKKRRE